MSKDDSQLIQEIHKKITAKHTQKYGNWFKFNTLVTVACAIVLFWWYYSNWKSEKKDDKKIVQSKKLISMLSRMMIVALLDIVMDD